MGFLCSELGFLNRARKGFMHGGGKICILGRWVVEIKDF